MYFVRPLSPKNVKALASTGRENGQTTRIFEAVEALNHDHKSAHNKICACFDGKLRGKTTANVLTQVVALVGAYGHIAIEGAKYDLGDTRAYCESSLDAVHGADALALSNEWTEFRAPNREKVGTAMNIKVVVDGHNLNRREIVGEACLDYYGINTN